MSLNSSASEFSRFGTVHVIYVMGRRGDTITSSTKELRYVSDSRFSKAFDLPSLSLEGL